MQIYVLQKSSFLLRGRASFLLPILGKNALVLLCERFHAAPLSVTDFRNGNFARETGAVILYPEYPFLSTETLCDVLKRRPPHAEWVGFPAGLILQNGTEPPVRMQADCGLRFASLSDYAPVIAEAKHISCRALQRSGVYIPEPESVAVDFSARVESGSVLLPHVRIGGSARIGKNCRIGQGCILKDCVIRDGAVIPPYSVVCDRGT